MPYKDGTGPMGYGPMTGRGMGPCRREFGFGRGRRYGMGMGMGMGWNAQPCTLADRKRFLQEELKRIDELLEQEGKEG
ncbi:MAG TPA: DUF5320 domain-containing protein [Sphaerochaeta sp.]|nr:DUF5320 domain-containing protein [Sphaerochaeta sp.]